MTDRPPAPNPARRRFVADGCRLIAASACLPLATLLPGCSSEPPPTTRGTSRKIFSISSRFRVMFFMPGNSTGARLVVPGWPL